MTRTAASNKLQSSANPSRAAAKSGRAPRSAKNADRHALREKASHLASHEIAFIYDPSFAEDGSLKSLPNLDGGPTDQEGPSGDAYARPLLTAEEEARLFKQMNFFKYRANMFRSTLDPRRPTAARIEAIEKLLTAALKIRDRLIYANLRLVVSIARRFVDPVTTLEELTSDGNLTLMHAVEKFDAGRGFRFSTYATHAIQRCYYARLRKQSKLPRLTQGAEDLIDCLPDRTDDSGDGQEDRARLERLERLLAERLDDRERLVLQARFGIAEESGPQTLRSLGRRLHLSKERVRQLQMRAIERLHNAPNV